MKKEKYFYNTSTLRYERVNDSWKSKILRFVIMISTVIFFSIIVVTLYEMVFDSPKEKFLKDRIVHLKKKYIELDRDVSTLNQSLNLLRDRDIYTYRSLFGQDPLDDKAWNTLSDSILSYKVLFELSNEELMKKVQNRLTWLKEKMTLQDSSYNELSKLIENKQKQLASTPSIQPISNEDLKRMASGYGRRIDPVYGIPKMHWGMDFSAPTGTDVYATGNGIVKTANYSNGGYGKQVVIDHGNGYQTLYAHLHKHKVSKGQHVKRGDIIGYVGNTGKSVGSHLHYEVRYKGQKLNPAYFYYNDLTDEQYEKMLHLSSSEGQSLD